MALKFALKTAKIEIDGPDNYVEVRGLSLKDIVQLVELHRPVIEDLFNRFSGKTPEAITEADAAETIMEMLDKAPSLVAHIIALGADAAEQFDEIVNLPVGAQVTCLEKIGEFTFATGGGPKKLLGLALKMAGNARSKSSLPT